MENPLQNSEFPRRSFLRMAGAAGAMLPGMAFAGPFSSGDFAASGQNDFESLVPSDKKLSPEWVASLTARGVATRYTGDALQNIGMPIGGICCGLVYLSGDGRLWHWDIFNENRFGVSTARVEYKGASLGPGDGSNYIKAPHPESPFHFGFTLRADSDKPRAMDASGWRDVSFLGEYPIGEVDYSDPDSAISAKLTAFSPFIPLSVEDSDSPLVYLRYRLTNHSNRVQKGQLEGLLQNPVANHAVELGIAKWDNNVIGRTVQCGVVPLHVAASQRPDELVEDCNRAVYAPWKVEGDAFGKGPILRKDAPAYQGDLGGVGDRVVNTHSSAPGNTVEERDQKQGKLTSPEFRLNRRFLNLWIGGGNHPGKTCVNVVVSGQVVGSLTGADDNKMHLAFLDLKDFEGKTFTLEIVDHESGPWGNIGVGRIWQSDSPANAVALELQPDYGTIAITALGKAPVSAEPIIGLKTTGGPTATIAQSFSLEPGASVDLEFAVSWHFVNARLGIPDDATKRHYAKRFKDAHAVAQHFASNQKHLVSTTELWRKTWYGTEHAEGLPHWFLERAMSSASTLATTVCHRFGSGRFYAWEGIGCCAGTCVHVWHYAQSVGRLFPALERDTRERVDLGIGFNPQTGGIGFRAEFDHTAAVDGQAGTICRILREHQMSPDDAFLKRVWPRTKQALQYLMAKDPEHIGVLEGDQPNTQDAAWFGKIPWLTSLYLAALAAGKHMALLMGDSAFAAQCEGLLAKGQENIKSLFNGEYFIQTVDPTHPMAFGPYEGCLADQVFGQSWAFQVGLGRVLPEKETKAALQAIWKYNFAPDVGVYRDKMRPGRWYAIAGDAGLIVVTNPKQLPNPYKDPNNWAAIYFNECWTGVEHHVAGHMIAEGMTTQGLAVMRAVHDRHSALKRNPYNEIECSDHYSRAMSSFGPFITATGFTYDGPSGQMGLAPTFLGDRYEIPFIAAEGWGVFTKTDKGYELSVRHGRLRLKKLRLPSAVSSASVEKASTIKIDGNEVGFVGGLVLQAGENLKATF